jgi:glutaredoxin
MDKVAVVFTMKSCPFCQMLKENLDKEGIEYVDRDIQFQKAFLDPIKAILDTMGWHTEKVSTLEDFFS